MSLLPQIQKSLQLFYDKMKGKDILWILSGSVSLVLQGVDVKINNDIDILTDKEGFAQIDETLADYRVVNFGYSTGNEKYKSYFAKYDIDGVNLDLQGEFQYKLKDGGRSKPNQTNEISYITYENMKLPVLKLEQELREYENMENEYKVSKIKEVLSKLRL